MVWDIDGVQDPSQFLCFGVMGRKKILNPFISLNINMFGYSLALESSFNMLLSTYS